MKRRLPILALLGAWICANGALLDAVQVFAWARMFGEYARTMDARTALSRTFDPARPCHLCRTVSRARDKARSQLPTTVEKSAEKLLLALHQPSPVFFAEETDSWEFDCGFAGPARREPVPVPPPRLLS